MNAIVNAQRSPGFQCASTDSMSFEGELASRGDGVDMDAKGKFLREADSTHQSVDSAGPSAQRCFSSPGLSRLRKPLPKSESENKNLHLTSATVTHGALTRC